MIMNQTEIVEIAVKDVDLTPVKLAKLSGFNPEEIEFVKIFWDPTFNNSWLYISKDMVVDWLGYKDGKSTMSDFYKNLKNNYEKDLDFKEADLTNELVNKSIPEVNLRPNNIPSNKKYYIITGDCLKNLLMSAKTQKGKFVRKIYIKTEKLVFVMMEVHKAQKELIYKNELLFKDKLLLNQTMEIEVIKNKSLAFKSEVIFTEKHSPNGFIYINTTDQYSKYNIYRVGRTEKLVQRQKQYQLGRISCDTYYYVYTFETECVEILEIIILKFLNKYKENSTTRKDLFVMNLDVLKPMIKNICIQFQSNMIPVVNQMIEMNLEEIANRDPDKIVEAAKPYIFQQEVVEGIMVMPKYKYYGQLLEIINTYPDVELVTLEEDIVHSRSKINIICSHANREVQVTTILTGGIGCVGCLKDKRTKEKEVELQISKLESFDAYNVIELIDETTTEFLNLKTSDRNQKKTQNIIINLLMTENIKLITPYKTSNERLSYVCSYGHTSETSGWSLKKLTKDFCKTCKSTQTDIKEASIRRHATEQELVTLATSIGWTHIRKTLIRGLIEWRCPNNHIVSKVLRELRRGFCAECKNNDKI